MNNFKTENEVKKDALKGLIMQFAGILTALLPLLGILGISLNWFNQDFIDSLEVVLLAILAFGVNAYAIYKNHYSGKKAQEQNRVLKNRGMK